MITARQIITALFLALLPLAGSAQSVEYAKSLIEQGQYLEGAKQLRPLADGGNAEAQYEAACLFFDGKGVNKSEAQGIKYATLAAEQGYQPAVTLLAGHYRDKKDAVKWFQTLKKYTDKFPDMQKSTPGVLLALCYFWGEGTEKNPAAGIRIVDNNKLLEGGNKNIKYSYWRGKANLAGYSDVRAYNEAEYGAGRLGNHAVMARAIYDWFYDLDIDQLRKAANQGKSWEMAHLSNMLNAQSNKSEALQWAQKAAEAGSNYGKGMLRMLSNAAPNAGSSTPGSSARRLSNRIRTAAAAAATATGRQGSFRVSSYRTNAFDAKVTRVEAGPKYTTVTLVYNNQTNASQRLTINPNTHIVCNGRTYRMTHNNVPTSGTLVPKGATYDIRITFPPIPSDGSGFDLIENGLWKFYDIKY